MTEFSSAEFWEERYAAGHGSGAGSRGGIAQLKATVINKFVAIRKVWSVIEFGCGDGYQLSLATYPLYVGLDVSETAVEMCRERFADDGKKTFHKISPELEWSGFDLALSLDVIYHLIEEDVYAAYLRDLFAASDRFVMLYTTNDISNHGTSDHVFHRPVLDDIARDFPEWKLVARRKGVENCWFYAYEKSLS